LSASPKKKYTWADFKADWKALPTRVKLSYILPLTILPAIEIIYLALVWTPYNPNALLGCAGLCSHAIANTSRFIGYGIVWSVGGLGSAAILWNGMWWLQKAIAGKEAEV
jgi:hypothetical protein